MNYSVTVRQFYEFIDKQPTKIKPSDIERYIQHIIDKYDTNTLTVKFSAMKVYLKFLNRRKLNNIEIDEELLQPPTIIHKPKTPLTKEELKKLLEISKHHPRDYALIYALIGTVARSSEVVGINVDDVDFKENKIYIRDEKTHQHSIRCVTPECIDAIKSYVEEHREIPKNGEKGLFLNYNGQRITTQTVWNTLKYIAVTIGFEKNLHPHLIRHSCITIMAQSGMSAPEIMAHSGHKSLKVVQRYIHLSELDVKDKVLHSLSMTETPKTAIESEVFEPQEQPSQQITEDVKEPPVLYKVPCIKVSREQEEEKQPKPTPTDMTHNTTKRQELLQLLKKGFITPQEFEQLITQNQDTMYQ